MILLATVQSVLICIFFLFCFFSSRRDWSRCGKHWVLPWRNGQCKHQWCKWPGWPQQPAELSQWWGLLHLQSKTGLLCLKTKTNKHQPILSLQLQSFMAFTFQSTSLQLHSPHAVYVTRLQKKNQPQFYLYPTNETSPPPPRTSLKFNSVQKFKKSPTKKGLLYISLKHFTQQPQNVTSLAISLNIP